MHLNIRRGVGGYKDKAWKGYGKRGVYFSR